MKSLLHYLVNTDWPKPVSYYDSNFGKCKTVIRLTAFPHRVLNLLFSELVSAVDTDDTEIIHHCLDDSISGLIFPKSSVGIYAADIYDNDTPCCLSYCGDPMLKAVRESRENARLAFFKARAFHDQQEKIYLSQMDFSAADRLTQKLIADIFGKDDKREGGSTVHRFFGTASFKGSKDHSDKLTDAVERRIFIKGRPGTGKSTLLKKVAQHSTEAGYLTECYHCAFDSGSLDMVIIRELGISLLDSTAPHEYFPTRPGDEILDMYLECVTPGTDERYRKELDHLESAYKELIEEGISHLQNMKSALRGFEAKLPAMDTAELKELKESLLARLT